MKAAAIQNFECPYCHASTSVLYSFQALSLTVEDFGALLQLGWCRCGSLIYRPDPNVRCCPQFSMRIKTNEFVPTRKHRRILRNFAMQPQIRYLGESLKKVLKALRLIRDGIDYPYPYWFIHSNKGIVQSRVVPELIAAISIPGPLERIRNQLMHFIVHHLQEMPNIALNSLRFDGSGLIFMRISQSDSCSFCDCGAQDCKLYSKYLTWVVKSEDDLRTHWESIRLDTELLEKWESTSKRPPKLRTVLFSKCRRHDRHKSREDYERRRLDAYSLFNEPIDDNIEISMEPCSYTEEKFQLYLQYQILVHNEKYDFPTREKFQESIVRSPLTSAVGGFGSFHRCYRRKDTQELIAFTLIDILPAGLNSLYFVWNQQWRQFSLGIFSILDEIQLVERRRESNRIKSYYYIGIYVDTCPKMSYKRQFKPSELKTKFGWMSTEQALAMSGDVEERTPLLQNALERNLIQLDDICDDLLVRVGSDILTFRQLSKRSRFTFEQLKQLFLFSLYVGDLAGNFVYIIS